MWRICQCGPSSSPVFEGGNHVLWPAEQMRGGLQPIADTLAEFGLRQRIAKLADQAAHCRQIMRLGVAKRRHVYLRTSSITLPSLGRLPGRANSTLPPTLQTVRMVASIAFSRSGEACGAST